jgi:hypothetical protein
MQNLQFLDLSVNAFIGEFPTARRHTSSLKLLNLANNYFHGEFPSVIQKCKNLTILNLGRNRYYGIIPSWLGVINPRTDQLQNRRDNHPSK